MEGALLQIVKQIPQSLSMINVFNRLLVPEKFTRSSKKKPI